MAIERLSSTSNTTKPYLTETQKTIPSGISTNSSTLTSKSMQLQAPSESCFTRITNFIKWVIFAPFRFVKSFFSSSSKETTTPPSKITTNPTIDTPEKVSPTKPSVKAMSPPVVIKKKKPIKPPIQIAKEIVSSHLTFEKSRAQMGKAIFFVKVNDELVYSKHEDITQKSYKEFRTNATNDMEATLKKMKPKSSDRIAIYSYILEVPARFEKRLHSWEHTFSEGKIEKNTKEELLSPIPLYKKISQKFNGQTNIITEGKDPLLKFLSDYLMG